MSSPRRLTTWKDIGAYIGRDARTAKRYEAERRLPVHRLPGGGRSVVFAFAEELDAWLGHQTPAPEAPAAPTALPAAAPAPPAEPPAEPRDGEGAAARPRVRATRLWLLVAGAALLVAGALFYVPRRAPAARGPDPIAAAAFRDGEFAWRQRTPDALRRAVDDYTQAIVRDPDFAAAYVGLANSYDLMPEFGGMSSADAYTRAEAAARRALALAPNSAAAHQTFAFVLFWWERDVPRALREFQTALRLDPGAADAHHWYANALAEIGDPRAIAEIDKARALDPASLSIMTDSGWTRVMLGRYGEARQILRTVQGAAPDSPQLHSSLAFLDRIQGDYPGMLAELAQTAQLRHDAEGATIAAAGQRGLAQGGQAAMWAAMVPLEEAANRADRLQDTTLAADELRLGRRAETLRLLDEAFVRREPAVLGLRHSPDAAPLGGDPAFERLVARLGPTR